MDLDQLKESYITPSEIAGEMGVPVSTVFSWINYWRHFPAEKIFGSVAVKRTDYDVFRKAHPELAAPQKQAA